MQRGKSGSFVKHRVGSVMAAVTFVHAARQYPYTADRDQNTLILKKRLKMI